MTLLSRRGRRLGSSNVVAMTTTARTDAVHTTRLTKKYGDRLAVNDVEITVRRGEIYGFLGPNGAGKTTTLRMILGLVRPSGGTATVLGEPAGSPSVMARVGALIEGPGFYPYLTGRANLAVMARYRSLGKHAVDEALERVDLGSAADEKFKGYSLGMKQRLGVACALMGQPDLIVLDEPTNGLDPAGMADMRALLRRLADDGQTILLSSHQLTEVQELCDRVGVISRGRLLQESTVRDLLGDTVVAVRAEPMERTLATLMRVVGDDAVKIDGNRVRAAVASSRAPEIARELVAAGVELFEIGTRERSLEDVFFEMTTEPRDRADAELEVVA